MVPEVTGGSNTLWLPWVHVPTRAYYLVSSLRAAISFFSWIDEV